jgi:hypothetical protein
MIKGHVKPARALTQHDNVCFQCTLPECTPNSPACAYWAGAPPWMRAYSTLPQGYLKALTEFLQTTREADNERP